MNIPRGGIKRNPPKNETQLTTIVQTFEQVVPVAVLRAKDKAVAPNPRGNRLFTGGRP